MVVKNDNKNITLVVIKIHLTPNGIFWNAPDNVLSLGI